MGTYSYSGKIEVITIQTTGYYDITAYGAQGGGTKHNFGNDYEAFPGGEGAMVSGGFYLNAGDLIQIVVGGQGHPGFMAGNTDNGGGGGGGGGSFVVNLTGTYGNPTPLIIAGGGGGAGTDGVGYEGVGAGHGTNGGRAPNGGAGGAYGAPGQAGPNSFSPGDHYTGGGGGYGGGRGGIGVRQPHAGYAKGQTPYGAYAGGQGGYHGYTYGWGGFGGGGGGGIIDAEQNKLYGGGGGGGGWGGGGGGGHKGGYGGGGGGGSLDTGIHAVTQSGVRSGNGEVVITLTTPPGTAAPGQSYTAPTGSLRHHHVDITSNHLVVCTADPNPFIHGDRHEHGDNHNHGGRGENAHGFSHGFTHDFTRAFSHDFTGSLEALAGLIGSNALAGYSGSGTLFADHRGRAADHWGKANEPCSGDAATRWGVAPRDFGLAWADGRVGSILHR